MMCIYAIKVGDTRNRSIIRSVMKRFNSQLVAVDYNTWFSVEGIGMCAGGRMQRYSPFSNRQSLGIWHNAPRIFRPQPLAWHLSIQL